MNSNRCNLPLSCFIFIWLVSTSRTFTNQVPGPRSKNKHQNYSKAPFSHQQRWFVFTSSSFSQSVGHLGSLTPGYSSLRCSRGASAINRVERVQRVRSHTHTRTHAHMHTRSLSLSLLLVACVCVFLNQHLVSWSRLLLKRAQRRRRSRKMAAAAKNDF